MNTLNIGDPAPNFELQAQDGKTWRLADFEGQNLLVYFYPKADTPGCTTQSCAVRDAHDELAGLDAKAIGISPDKPEKQAKFDNKFDLGFPLLADTDHSVAESYGAWGEKSMYGKKYMGMIRSSFLVDESGKIAGAWYKVKAGETVPKALEALGG
ncbi:MAG: thioredoxin-dependent thiol peroxidase [Actinomycetota bacterium]